MSTMPPSHRVLDYRVEPFDLQLFSAVVEHGTITAAAAAMSLSLAAASARLKALEHRVGVPLLERSKTGARVTEAGRALARQAQRVLAELAALHTEMAAFGRGLRGTLRLVCNTAAMAEALPPRLGRFLAAQPDIDLDLQELPSDAVLQALHRGAADLGIVADHVDTSGLVTHPWREDELVALLPAPRTDRSTERTRTRITTDRTSARAPRPLGFAQLLERPFVGRAADSGLSRFLAQQAARCGRVPHHRVRVSHFDAVARLVAAGVGVAVLPRSAAERWRAAALHIVPLAEPWARRRLLLCHTAAAAARPGMQALLASLLSPE